MTDEELHQAQFTNDVDVLFGSLNAEQRQFLKVLQGLVRYGAKQDLKELTE